MYSGWYTRFPLDRPLTDDERRQAFRRAAEPQVEPDDRAALIHFNSTYADFIDRRFRLRGGLGADLGLFALAVGLGVTAFAWIENINRGGDGWTSEEQRYLIMSLFTVGMLSMIFFVLYMLLKDFFTYTHYPIRYNRKTRKIHVFRHNGPGGVLTVPWEQGYFHLGRGIRNEYALDMRCHVLDGDTVKDTFATGGIFVTEGAVHQLWQFIRTYMEEGPAALGRGHFISMTPATSLRNCFHMAALYLNIGSMPLLLALSPLVGLVTLTRWLVMKTSRRPVWPPDIEAESAIEPGDPHVLKEPGYAGQPYEDDAKLEQAVRLFQRDGSKR